MELHIKIAGIILVALACIHIVFPKYFDWKNDLKPLSLINRQIMYVHTFFIAFTTFLMGLLCIVYSSELLNTLLGNKIMLGLSIFWGTRLFMQFFGYSAKLWMGKKFETAVHVLFSCLWLYVSIVFFYAYWANRNK